MNDLSRPADSTGTDPIQSATSSAQSSVQPAVSTVTSQGNKEVVGGSINPSENLRDATGKEAAIPKEVASVGVKVRPTTIPIPPPVSRMGIKPAGTNIPVQTTSKVVLPLSDDQIARGLHEGITSSLRWLSEWCIRRLKQLHIAVKSVHGKFVRVKES